MLSPLRIQDVPSLRVTRIRTFPLKWTTPFTNSWLSAVTSIWSIAKRNGTPSPLSEASPFLPRQSTPALSHRPRRGVCDLHRCIPQPCPLSRAEGNGPISCNMGHVLRETARFAAGGLSLKITATPAVAGLLAGKTVMILKDNLESILALGGVTARGGKSGAPRACARASTDATCKKGEEVLQFFLVTQTVLDANGSGNLANVPNVGVVYVMADAAASPHLLWNLRLDLKPGTNSITLTESNTTLIK
jgi:hypothetical protein